MAEIITDGSQKELKKHGSDEFPLLVSYEHETFRLQIRLLSLALAS